MTLIEEMQKLISRQKEEQKLRFESIESKNDEAHKFEQFAQACHMKIGEIKEDLEKDKIYIQKLEAIVKSLQGDKDE